MAPPTQMRKSGRFRDHLFRLLRWEDIDKVYLRQLIRLARDEDLEGSGLDAIPMIPGDVTTDTLAPEDHIRVKLVARHPLTVCGLPLIPYVLDGYGEGCSFSQYVEESVPVKRGECLGKIAGPATVLLRAERVLLNFLQHLSGIATQTAGLVEAMQWSPTKLLDTRETTPGLRVLEKYAVAQGGGWNHRMGLFERVLIRDRHLEEKGAAVGEELRDAVYLSRLRNPNHAVEVEVHRLEQIPHLLAVGVDILLLANFSVRDLTRAVALIGDQAYTEATGGITIESLPTLANIGLDFISCGSLISESVWVDIGLEWESCERWEHGNRAGY